MLCSSIKSKFKSPVLTLPESKVTPWYREIFLIDGALGLMLNLLKLQWERKWTLCFINTEIVEEWAFGHLITASWNGVTTHKEMQHFYCRNLKNYYNTSVHWQSSKETRPMYAKVNTITTLGEGKEGTSPWQYLVVPFMTKTQE